MAAQDPDSTQGTQVLQAPGPRYGASGLHELFFGREYRSLWTTPVSVAVLDLRSFGGGLEPVSKGGGQQTKSLLLRAPDGREFFFRSVDKDPSGTLPPELRPRAWVRLGLWAAAVIIAVVMSVSLGLTLLRR